MPVSTDFRIMKSSHGGTLGKYMGIRTDTGFRVAEKAEAEGRRLSQVSVYRQLQPQT